MKRWMQVVMGGMVILGLAGLAGCGGDDGGGAGGAGDDALIGDWVMTSMSVNGGPYFAPGAIGWNVRLRLDDSGTALVTEVWQGETESSSGGWTATGGQLTLSAGWYSWTGAYTAGANNFHLNGVANYDGEGDTGSFVFTRM